MEKDKALFVGFFYWSGYNKQTLWQTFDEVYELAEKFVKTYDPEDTWEDESFEEYMDTFIRKHMDV